MLQYFKEVIGNEIKPGIFIPKQQMIAEIKRSYAFSEGFMVGDSVTDIVGGKNEGLKTIAVTYGYENAETLKNCHPDAIVDNFPEVFDIVSKIIRP